MLLYANSPCIQPHVSCLAHVHPRFPPPPPLALTPVPDLAREQASMRVAVYGAKHDAAMFEELLKGYCVLDPEHTLGSAMIDTACLGTPKVRP